MKNHPSNRYDHKDFRFTARQEAIFWRRLMADWTLQEIGEHFGLSKERIRQIFNQILRRLRFLEGKQREDDPTYMSPLFDGKIKLLRAEKDKIWAAFRKYCWEE